MAQFSVKIMRLSGSVLGANQHLYRTGEIREVACLAHVRRKFVDVHKAQGSAIAEEAIRRIAALYAVEKAARGSPPDKRVKIRQAEVKPVFDGMEAWLNTQLHDTSGKSPLAAAIRCALTRLARLRPYLDHGILEIDNRAIVHHWSEDNGEDRRTRDALRRFGPLELPLRRIANRRQSRRHRLHTDRNRKTERR